MCPVCQSVILSVSLPSKPILHVLSNLDVYCLYKEQGCDNILNLSDLWAHTLTCTHSTVDDLNVDNAATPDCPSPAPRKGRPPGSIIDAKQAAQNSRLRTIKQCINNLNIQETNSSICVALAINSLRAAGDRGKAELIKSIFNGKFGSLSAMQCLAYKVNNKMSWNSYRASAKIVNHAFGDLQIFRSERALKAAERKILPGSALYSFSPPLKTVSSDVSGFDSINVLSGLPADCPL